MNPKNTALVICGPFNEMVLRMAESYQNIFNEIVISTYENDNELLQKLKTNNNVKVIEYKTPSVENLHNSQNIYFQCFTTFNGMNCTKSEFAIKLRSDEFYSNLDKVLLTLPKTKVTTSNIFVRDIHYKHFHLSDHIIIGKTLLLKNAFFNLMEYIQESTLNSSDKLTILNDRIPAEVKITLFILFEFENNKIFNWNTMKRKNVYELMYKNFHILDVDSLSPCIMNASAIGKIFNYKEFVNSDIKLGLRYINSIEELYPRNIFQRFIDKRKIKLRKFRNNSL